MQSVKVCQGAHVLVVVKKRCNFIHRRLYAQKFLRTKQSYKNKKLLLTRRFYAEALTDRRLCTKTLLHTEAFTPRVVTDRKILHTGALKAQVPLRAKTFTRGCLSTGQLSYQEAFAHIAILCNFYTQKLWHTEPFIRRKPLDQHVFTDRCLCTQTLSLSMEALQYT